MKVKNALKWYGFNNKQIKTLFRHKKLICLHGVYTIINEYDLQITFADGSKQCTNLKHHC